MTAPHAEGIARVTRAEPCSICGRPTWCGRSPDGSVALCMRVGEGASRTAPNGAHVHVLRHDPDRQVRVRTVRLDPPPPDMAPIVRRAIAATPAAWLAHLADSLGLPAHGGVAVLRRLGCHRERPDVAGFPMRRRGRVVGIRYRSSSGSKWARKGGKEGTFVPTGIEAGAPLWITEGPTDTAALLSVGCAAIGRPSATGHDAVVEVVRALRPAAIVVVADVDTKHDVGQRTAVDLAQRCALLVPSVVVVLPPGEAKDARAAVVAGARRADFMAQVAKAQPMRLVVAQ